MGGGTWDPNTRSQDILLREGNDPGPRETFRKSWKEKRRKFLGGRNRKHAGGRMFLLRGKQSKSGDGND